MEKTANYNMELPDEERNISEEFPILRENLKKIDTALDANKKTADGKAAKDHKHSMSDISGLETALTGKMPAEKTFGVGDLTDIDNHKDAPKGYILTKNTGGNCTFASPAAAMGEHKHKVSDISDINDNFINKTLEPITAGVSINNISKTGIYALTGEYPDGPLGDNAQYVGHLWVSMSPGDLGALSQMLFNNGKLWIRVLSSTFISAWQRVVTSTDVDILAPTGKTIFYDGTSAPKGYLVRDGSLLSTSAYPELFKVLGTRYGGNGTTTFGVGDFRGEFIRGLDSGRGVDSGRVLGTSQGDAMRNISGTIVFHNGTENGVASTNLGGATGVFSLAGEQWNSFMVGKGSTGAVSARSASFNASSQVPTANENRPRNIALLACIKY